jgi:hypothetical protein
LPRLLATAIEIDSESGIQSGAATTKTDEGAEEEETKQSSLVNFRKSDPDFKVSPQDMKFLKSLRITIDHPDKPV